MVTNETMFMKCMVIEEMVRDMVLRGVSDNRLLIKAVDEKYKPQSEFEMEMYSESIIYAKLGVLN
jgi:hypothetical protein